METKEKSNKTLIDGMFNAGAHFAYSPRRRHPQAVPFIYGAKNNVEIFDLEKTSEKLLSACEYVRSLGKEGKVILFVGGKSESQLAIKNAATSISMPYVAGRWIGGTLTNFNEIKKRVQKMEETIEKKEKGELAKYTKKERLLIDREVEKLERFFSGIRTLKEKPAALFVIDQKREKIAVTEASKQGVIVVSLSGSDCNLKEVDFAIPGNDSSISSISFFVNEIAKAYREGSKERESVKAVPSQDVVYTQKKAA